MKTRPFSLRRLTLAAATTLLLVAAPRLPAQMIYSMGANGTNGTPGTAAPSQPQVVGQTGGPGGAGGPALDLTLTNTVIAGTYNGGTGGQGGMGGFAEVVGGNGGPGGAGGAAVVAEAGSSVSITGGVFHFGLGGAGGVGPMETGGNGLTGSAGANGYTLVDNGGAITLFGTFTGGSRTLPAGTGSFMGMLTNATAAQTFTYNDVSGAIVLVNAAPEPSTWATVGVGIAGLGLVWHQRRRAA